MADENALTVEIREGQGKGAARKLRARGLVPGVCYGHGAPNTPIALDAHKLDRLLSRSSAGMNTLIDLHVSGGGDLQGRLVMVKELQRDPVTSRMLHADLYAVDLEERIDVQVPVHLVGHPKGALEGGILDHTLREIECECLPRAIPEELTVDVSALEIGDSIHVRELTLPEGVRLLSDPDLGVVSVVAPRALEEEAPAEGEEAVAAAEGEAPAEGEGESEGDEESKGD